MRAVRERPHEDFNTALAERFNFDERRRIGFHMGMRVKYALDDLTGFLDIIFISNVKAHIDAANRVMAMVDNLLAPDFAIGDDDLLIIKGLHIGCEEVDFFDIAE